MVAVEEIRDRIRQACENAGRAPEEVTLIAVSKTRSAAEVRRAYEQGIRHFGENRTEELAEKSTALADLADIRWHFIGRLQSRQTPVMVRNAHVFHAVDRLKIAEEIAKHRARDPLPSFIQVNVSGEEAKAGLPASDWREDAGRRADLAAEVGRISQVRGVALQGLMTMLPYGVSSEEARIQFRCLRELSAWLRTEGGIGLPPALSMGMSGDFEAAIEEGATHVRIGTAVFGDR